MLEREAPPFPIPPFSTLESEPPPISTNEDMVLGDDTVTTVVKKSLPTFDVSKGPFVSYKNTLINNGSMEENSSTSEDWKIEEGDVMVDRSGEVPAVTISSRAHNLIAENMKLTVLVRLMGRNIGFKSMQFHIMRLWKPSGSFHLIEVGNNFFMVRFDVPEDYLNALTLGPWMVFGLYLIVQPWSANFNPEISTVESIVAWIRLPNLPIHLYHPGILKEIAGAIGRVYKVDQNTSSIERGKYARFAVGVDLTKPLLAHIVIDGRKQHIEYEGLPSICFLCGNYGHLQASCPKKPKISPTGASLEAGIGAFGQVQTKDSPSELWETMKNDNLVAGKRDQSSPSSSGKDISPYGPWMQVARRGKRPEGTGKGGHQQLYITDKNKARGGSGSRFAALDGLEGPNVKKGILGQTHATLNPQVNDTELALKAGARKNPMPRKSATSMSINPPKTPPVETLVVDSSPPKPVVDKMDNRTPLAPHPPTNRVLDPSKHSVAYITDDLVHYSNSSFLMDFSSNSSKPNVSNKENSFRHPSGSGIDRKRGVNLSTNSHKALKVKNLKNNPLQHSEKLKKAILSSLSDTATIDPGSL